MYRVFSLKINLTYGPIIGGQVNVLLELDRSVLENILLGQVDVAGKTGAHPYTPQAGLIASFESGDVRLVRGTPEDFKKFFSYFDSPSQEPIPLTIR